MMNAQAKKKNQSEILAVYRFDISSTLQWEKAVSSTRDVLSRR